MMKLAVKFAALAALVVAPALAFAQSAQSAQSIPAYADHAPITRAEVRGQLVELEQAGYDPAMYPGRIHTAIEQAQAVIARQHAQAAAAGVMVQASR